MSRIRRAASYLPSWFALLGASSGLSRFQDDERTWSNALENDDITNQRSDRKVFPVGHEKSNRLSFVPSSFLAHCKSDASPSHGDSMESYVKKMAEEIWSLLDQHVHRVFGSLRAARESNGTIPEISIPHPEVSVNTLSNGFHVTYLIPRQGMIPIDMIVRGLQLALRKNQQQSMSLSKQETFGSEGRATGVRIHSSQYGNLSVDVLQPFDVEKLCRLEFRGDLHEGIVNLMSDAMEYVTSGNGKQQNPFESMFDIGDRSMVFDSMEQMMRMFMDRGMMHDGHFGSDPFPDIRRDVPESGRRSEETINQSNSSIASRLESMGCQVFFPHPDRKPGQVDWGTLAGYEVQKKAIEENLLLPLQEPNVYDDLAKRTRAHYSSNRPRAVLFTGPPGTGKTSSARVIAQQASVPLCYIPLEALASKWYGESEKKLAEALAAIDGFQDGAVLFLDELDSLATTRGSDMHEATRRTLGVLLRHLDGFDLSKKTVIIGATNRPDDLDAALRSRFSATVHFGLPTNECRVAILKQYAMHLSDEDIHKLASVTDSMSGRDLRDICEVAERHWASLIIQGNVSKDSLPSLDTYLTSVHARKHSFGQ